jgi:unsaturated rhamnogalacturonyl hydrolase
MDQSPDAQHLVKVFAAMLTMQRASWEQGVAAQAMLEYQVFVTRYPEQDILPKLQVDPMVYLYGMAHEACLRVSDDGRLATRINGDDYGSGDGSALDPACIGETCLFILDKIHDSDRGTAESMRNVLDEMMNYLVKRGAPKMRYMPNDLLPEGHEKVWMTPPSRILH